MKSMKKILAFLLSLVMIVGVLSNTGAVIKVNAATENKVTIYYENEKWNGVPNIHYKVGSKWTVVPGVAMTASNEQEGYSYKYVISLGENTKTSVCFNDGNGNWDSLNAKNYTVSTGTYGIKNQKITELKEVVVTKAPTEEPTVAPTEVVTAEPTATATMPVVTVEPTATATMPVVTAEPTATATMPVVTTTPAGKSDLRIDYFSVNAHRPNTSFEMYLGGYTRVAPYTISYTMVNDATGEVVSDYSCTQDDGYYSTRIYTTTAGEYNLHITVADATGAEVTLDEKVTVPDFTISDIEASVDAPVVGTDVRLKAVLNDDATFYHPTTTYWTVKKDGKVVVDHALQQKPSMYTWTPEQAGTYEITVAATDFFGSSASYTETFEVAEKQNLATVYYNNKSWNNAYIHYKVNGVWTKVPGVEMKCANTNDYRWVYTIDLGTDANATVCFNNGENSWDSRNGKNYTVNAGCTGISDGKVQKLSLGFENINITADKGYLSAYATIVGGTAPYSVHTEYYGPTDYLSDVENSVTDYNGVSSFYTTHYSGGYSIHYIVTDALGQTAELEKYIVLDKVSIQGVEGSDKTGVVGEEASFYANVKDAYVYYMPLSTYWNVEKDGKVIVDNVRSECSRSFSFIPEEAGTYDITVSLMDSSGDQAEYTFAYTVKEVAKNVAVVYYSNSNWSNAYIHFVDAAGNWTKVPGVQMAASDNGAYTWMYVIDLGEKDSTKVCFNNGNNWWDSKDGKNYTVTAGVNVIK